MCGAGLGYRRRYQTILPFRSGAGELWLSSFVSICALVNAIETNSENIFSAVSRLQSSSVLRCDGVVPSMPTKARQT